MIPPGIKKKIVCLGSIFISDFMCDFVMKQTVTASIQKAHKYTTNFKSRTKTRYT